MPEAATSKTEGFVKTIVEELRRMASTETVVGKPITVDKKTLVPVIRISVGFGAGGGEGTGETPTAEKRSSGHGEGAGMGGAGGVRVEPVAFIVMIEDKVSLLPVRGGVASVERLIESVPDLIEKIAAIREKRGEKKT